MATDFRFFRVDNNKDLLTATYRLRYEIFCNETHFLNSGDYPDGIETDIYDNHSLHFAALNPKGDVVATVRLVLKSDIAFPLEKHCPRLFIDKNSLPRPYLAEISRLAVNKKYRGRAKDGLLGAMPYLPKKKGEILDAKGNPIPEDIQLKLLRSMIVLGLYRTMYQESKRRGITHWYAAMEKRLWYALKRFSFHFKPIGPEVNYYGPVTPYIGELPEVEKKLFKDKPLLMHRMLAGLDYRYWPKQMSSFLYPRDFQDEKGVECESQLKYG